MAVTHVAYEVEDWGVGELWLEGSRVVWHDLPFPARKAQVTDRHLELVEVVTYGELAALAEAPGAARAAGSFCARNRLGLFVPCHRVVGADGLGSYGSFGLDYKRRLLELEGYVPHAL